LFDAEMTMKLHMSKPTSVCYYHLRPIRQPRRHVDQPVLMHLASALLLSRLDYCNMVLSGLPASTIAPVQRVQNAAARLAFGLRPRDHVSPLCSLLKSIEGLKSYYGGIPGCSPNEKCGTFLINPHFSACRPESIGMLMMQMSRTVESYVEGIFS
jgi:hypothetical protein